MADVRYELTFRGGGRVAGEMAIEQWDLVRAAVTAGDGPVEVTAGGETWWVRADDVVFAHASSTEKRLGFQ
jgi:hypothetical protein